MSYKIFDVDGHEITHIDLQLKGPWYSKGEESEKVFIKKFGNQFSLEINPEKVDQNTYLIL